jgi:glycine cleavage system H protein
VIDMVAITVVLIIVGLLLLDLLVQFAEGWLFALRPPVEALALAGGGTAELPGGAEFPEGLFLEKNHTWARLDPGGVWRLGVDGSLARRLGRVDHVVVVEAGQTVREGDPMATILQGLHQVTVRSPVSGKVVEANPALDGARLAQSPYGDGWLCAVRPDSLANDTRRLMVGEDAERWHRSESARLAAFLGGNTADGKEPSVASLSEADRARFQRSFLDATR